MYQRRIVLRVIREWKLRPNSHIKGRTDIHINILQDFARSALRNPKQRKEFVTEVQRRHGRR
jgi:hypothetical protein